MTPLRVAVAGLAGAAQFLLVFGGCIFYYDLLAESLPEMPYWGEIACVVCFLSLFWPFYAFFFALDAMRAKAETRRAEGEHHDG